MDTFGDPEIGKIQNDGASGGSAQPYGVPAIAAVPGWALAAVLHILVGAANYVGYLAIGVVQYAYAWTEAEVF